jgi:hypothetical protein
MKEEEKYYKYNITHITTLIQQQMAFDPVKKNDSTLIDIYLKQDKAVVFATRPF